MTDGPESNVRPIRPVAPPEEPEVPPLVAWLRRQASSGLDEMFGQLPEKAYVRWVIEKHYNGCFLLGGDLDNPDYDASICGGWHEPPIEGCPELFDLAITYANFDQGGLPGRKEDGFKRDWLPVEWILKLR